MALLVKWLALGFGSGHDDLMVREFEPCIRLHTDSAEPAWDPLSLSLSLPLPHSLRLRLKINKKKKHPKSHVLATSFFPP